MSDKIDRIEKLIRIGADGSGATEHERANAAMRACTLIVEQNLSFRAPKEPKKVKIRRAPVDEMVNAVVDAFMSRAAPTTPYRVAVAAEDCACGEESCQEPIFRGERVWRRMKNGQVEYVHADCWHD